MNVIDTEIPEVKIIEPKVFGDSRGYFFESWSDKRYKEAGIDCNWIQDNESRSHYGVLRGLHYQAAPYTQAKLVRVIKGAVLDVAVDIRKGSPTFGKHVAVELSAENKYQLFIPPPYASHQLPHAHQPHAGRHLGTHPFAGLAARSQRRHRAAAGLVAVLVPVPEASVHQAVNSKVRGVLFACFARVCVISYAVA